jgi:hypothetical protein
VVTHSAHPEPTGQPTQEPPDALRTTGVVDAHTGSAGRGCDRVRVAGGQIETATYRSAQSAPPTGSDHDPEPECTSVSGCRLTSRRSGSAGGYSSVSSPGPTQQGGKER